jgi:hypothetical protein
VPAGALVALGVGRRPTSAQKLLLDLTPIADLTDALGGSSAWSAPLMAVVQGRGPRAAVRLGGAVTLAAGAPDVRRRARRASPVAQGAHVLDPAHPDGHLLAALTSFWPSILLPSRCIVAPVVASRHRRLAARQRARREQPLVAGHWLRSIGMMLTMGLIASLTAGSARSCCC